MHQTKTTTNQKMNTSAGSSSTAPMAAGAAKKTVLHQQLYGSRKFPRTPAQQDFHNFEHQYEIPSLNSYRHQHAHCPLRQSQSTIALNRLRTCGSYTTLPGAAGAVCATHGNEHVNPHQRWHAETAESICCFNNSQTMPIPQCTCGTNSFHQQHQQRGKQNHYQHLPQFVPQQFVHHVNPKPLANGYYFGYDNASHVTDEDSAFPGLPERELNLLHRNVPALRRTGVDTTGMRQYFYPDGGWGWIICGLAFLAHLLTTGLQLSYGILMIFIIKNLHNSTVGTEWLGALSWSISMIASPFVVALCRKKSTRLLAVVGGLMLPLGILFTSFATELGQVIFSYGFIFGIGVAMVRDSSAMILGTYFKRRRHFVEMVALSGEGVGIALFSVLLREGVGKAGWRLGLQIIAAILAVSFFMALLYRPASLYHPQRRAIQHLKNQRRKMRDDKTSASSEKQKKKTFLLLDISTLKSANVRILVMTSGVAAFGIYAPMFTISLSAEKEDIQDIVLLQAFLGISTTLGVVLASVLIRQPFRIRHIMVTSKLISQVFISTIAIAILFLSFVMGFQGLCVLSWIYGIGFGGFRYSIKILALERIKLKQFSKAWGFIRGIESVPVLVSVPLTTFLNDYSLKYGRAGYYICSAAAAIAGIIIFFINHTNLQQSNAQALSNRRCENGFIATLCPPAPPAPLKLNQRFRPFYAYNDVEYDFAGMDVGVSRSCISLNNIEANNYNAYSSPVCCRVHFQCFRNMPESAAAAAAQPFERNNRRRRTIDCGVRRPYPLQASSQYISGHGSVGSRMGKNIQRNLNSLRTQYCCSQHNFCNCPQRASTLCLHHQPSNFEMSNPLCTCGLAGNIANLHHIQQCRSLSVPEGLSTITQHCVCKASTNVLDQSARFCTEQAFHQQPYGSQLGNTAAAAAALRNCHIQTMDPLTKPLHYVEQMTTSV